MSPNKNITRKGPKGPMDPNIQNYLIRVSYDGTNYSGFQLQKNALTIQEKLEDAVHKVYKKHIRVAGAGRTDAGVHALDQGVTYYAPPMVPVNNIPLALNSNLPPDIVVWDAHKMPNYFHARIDAKGKTYSYTIDTSKYRQVIHRFYTWNCRRKLDISAMEAACSLFVGRHDFRAFQASGNKVENTFRTINHAQIIQKKDNNLVIFRVTGEGFLYKMVRLMAAVLVGIGINRISLDDLQEALVSPREVLIPPLPAKGLCLEHVHYDENFIF